MMLNPSVMDIQFINYSVIHTIAQTNNQTNNQPNNSPIPIISPPPESKPSQAFVVLPIGINVGKRNILQSS
jgi:hypothetical protein